MPKSLQWDTPVPEFPTMSHEFCVQISDWAQLGLTKEEIFEGSSIEYETLTRKEKDYFNSEYAYGKRQGLVVIARDLLNHSKTKNGLPATMAYLRRFSSAYEKAIDDDTASQDKETFVFNFANGKLKSAK